MSDFEDVFAAFDPENQYEFAPIPNQQKHTELLKDPKLDSSSSSVDNDMTCSCGNCIFTVSTIHEQEHRQCCQLMELNKSVVLKPGTCILDDKSFVDAITNKWTIGLMNEIDFGVEVPAEEQQSCLRFGCYRLASNLLYGYLGSGNRRALPVCVENFIKQTFPDPQGFYVGFKK